MVQSPSHYPRGSRSYPHQMTATAPAYYPPGFPIPCGAVIAQAYGIGVTAPFYPATFPYSAGQMNGYRAVAPPPFTVHRAYYPRGYCYPMYAPIPVQAGLNPPVQSMPSSPNSYSPTQEGVSALPSPYGSPPGFYSPQTEDNFESTSSSPLCDDALETVTYLPTEAVATIALPATNGGSFSLSTGRMSAPFINRPRNREDQARETFIETPIVTGSSEQSIQVNFKQFSLFFSHLQQLEKKHTHEQVLTYLHTLTQQSTRIQRHYLQPLIEIFDFIHKQAQAKPIPMDTPSQTPSSAEEDPFVRSHEGQILYPKKVHLNIPYENFFENIPKNLFQLIQEAYTQTHDMQLSLKLIDRYLNQLVVFSYTCPIPVTDLKLFIAILITANRIAREKPSTSDKVQQDPFTSTSLEAASWDLSQIMNDHKDEPSSPSNPLLAELRQGSVLFVPQPTCTTMPPAIHRR